jgi:hypothetical protein
MALLVVLCFIQHWCVHHFPFRMLAAVQFRALGSRTNPHPKEIYVALLAALTFVICVRLLHAGLDGL